MRPITDVIVLGGGSAGFLTALALKVRLPDLRVRVIRSKDIGVIGVGEGSTPTLTGFLHNYLKVPIRSFVEAAAPTWKLGLKFVWGPRPWFHYPFGPGMDNEVSSLPQPIGFYCDDDVQDATPLSALMSRDKVFEVNAGGQVVMHPQMAYHFENERFVHFLESHAAAAGVEILDDKVLDVTLAGDGIGVLRLASGRDDSAELYVDASGFASRLLGDALEEPFISFAPSLLCDRAVVGGWDRAAGEPIHPYTSCETMPAGWSWQIEHERRVNRGYVYCSSFIGDDAAEREFRDANPRVGSTRVVRFVSGRYERHWVGNVVAVGNASGFVEPLEATALGVIATQAQTLADALVTSARRPGPGQRRLSNVANARHWDTIRGFIAMHYKFNDRLDTPFWRACREQTDLVGAAPVVDYYREAGPQGFWEAVLLDPLDQFKYRGYATLLVGMRVPHERRHEPSASELAAWQAVRQQNRASAERALTVPQVLAAFRGQAAAAR